MEIDCQSPPSGFILLLRANWSDTENDMLIFSFRAKAIPPPICHESPSFTSPGTLLLTCGLMSLNESSML
ncbi:hypothetical protein D3C75_923410 [compost metagenome]